jgi:RNA polymerase sigma-70 factor, ECF subfamily
VHPFNIAAYFFASGLKCFSRGVRRIPLTARSARGYGERVPRSAKIETVGDEELVARVRAGETRLFAELVARYQDPVYSMSLRFIGDSAEAEDVAQEVFLRVHRGLASFKGEAKFSTWLYRITWNLCADWLRRSRKPSRIAAPLEAAGELSDGKADVEKGVLDAEEQEMVREALNGLDEIYRTVIILLYYQKLSYEEIALVLEVPVKTVETRLYRARRLLRTRLERLGHGGGG